MTVLARLPISFEVAGGTTHAPMIVVPLGGRDRRLVLDTGSEVHLLTEPVAVDLGLEMTRGEDGIDHTGATLASWTVGDVQIPLGGHTTVLGDVVAISTPPAFRERGIDGGLSPQLLHPTAYTVIDTIADELLLVNGTDDDVAVLIREGHPDAELLQLPRNEEFPTVVVAAAVDGFEAIPTLLNTGGKRTEISAAAAPTLTPGHAERLGGGVGGGDYAGWFAGAQTLVLAGARLPIPDLAVRETMHDPQCIAGMDVLRGTILACASDLKRPVYWLVPARGSSG